MSVERLEAEARRWLVQAEDDLEAADALAAVGKNAQAAFLAQQAGEKALEAFWIRLDLEPRGQSLARLINDLSGPERADWLPLLEAALALDKLYIPTRYPDALAELTPGEAYTPSQARAAIAHARDILQAVASRLG
jgi:HEPN domain-containing protein